MGSFRSFGFLLRNVSRLYVLRFEQRAAALGLTLPQCKALVHLAEHEGISQAQLAELIEIEPMSLVRILDRMESDGWLERRSDPADRRARRLHLNAKTRPLVAEIWRVSDLTRGESFAGVPRLQAQILIDTLERIQSNLAVVEPLLPAEPKNSDTKRTKAVRHRRERATTKA